MPFEIIRNDITKLKADAIVNAANTSLLAGSGVCGAIFAAAGADRLQKACNSLSPIKTGDAVITKGFDLPVKYIIHTAGPVYQDGNQNEEALLRSCYTNALDLAKNHKCESAAFPLISSGIYGYPKEAALSVATNAIKEWLMNNDMHVSLVVFDKTAFSLSKELLGEVKAFIDENYVDESHSLFGRRDSNQLVVKEAFADVEVATDEIGRTAQHEQIQSFEQMPLSERIQSFEQMPLSEQKASFEQKKLFAKKPQPKHTRLSEQPTQFAQMATVDSTSLNDVVGRLDEPFTTTLLRLIDASGKTDVEVYKRANLDRKLFSKIRTGKGYMPSKKTAVALAVALELSLSETRDLLERAGFALSHSVVFDVIIEYFITRKRYDIFEINNILFEYDQPLLGG